MADKEIDKEALLKELEALDVKLDEQKEIVRRLKANKAPRDEVMKEVTLLKEIKDKVEELEALLRKPKFNRQAFEEVMRRRFFFAPAFDIYHGVGGLFDWGPPGCALKAAFCQLWREQFVIEDGLFELDCTAVTPENVLAASGHKERFADFMVKDVKTGDCYRADKILEDHIDKLLEDRKLPADKRKELEREKALVESHSPEELHGKIQTMGVKATDTGNDLSEPFPFNLMFPTQIGPKGDQPAFLRPETAQGIFLNFKRMLDVNGGHLPFGAAQIGKAFRNEITPRSGLLRVREFDMAEIEYFVNPEAKVHAHFDDVKHLRLPLFNQQHQLEDGKIISPTLEEAVEQGIILSQGMAYFLGRTFQFLTKIGMDSEKIRFRQHLKTEMAHYACDCWDAEIECSYGWVECVGHADRSAFDLNCHATASKTDLTAYESFSEPKQVTVVQPVINKGILGKVLRKAAKVVVEEIERLAAEEGSKALAFGAKLQADGAADLVVAGETYNITKEMLSFKETTKKVHGRNFIPSVIEPSFGIGRVLYCLLEHAYYVREGDEQRAVLKLKPLMAPTKCAVLPLSNNAEFVDNVRSIVRDLRVRGISSKVDDSGSSIGRRYARMDEIGVPFGVTVDFDTKTDNTATLRERDSCEQVRMPIAEIGDIVRQLCEETIAWSDVVTKYGLCQT